MIFKLALRMLARDARAGELGLLAVAMTIAIAGMTTVIFFTERVQRALDVQASKLIGADLTIASDRAMPALYEDEARALGLTTEHALEFPSMVTAHDNSTLTEIRVVNAGYPVRGELHIADSVGQASHVAHAVPNAGFVWVDARLASQLNVNAGSVLDVGNTHLQVAAILTQEPGGLAGFGFFNALPHLLMNEADITATGLIQPGSRIRYRLYVAGMPASIATYRAWLQARVAPWETIERGDNNDPARGLLNRAAQYLSLTALLGVIIAAVAIALASRRFVARHLDACAMMRCLGARQATIVQLYALHFLVFGLIAGILGCALGYVAQFALAHRLSALMHLTLPNAGIFSALRVIASGMSIGLVLLAGFAVPPLIALARVPTLRVLRRDTSTPTIGGFAYAFGMLAIVLLVLWQAHDLHLGLYVIAGVVATALVIGAIAAGILRVMTYLKFKSIAWRYGVMHMQRRMWASSIQIVALGIGWMAILTLALIRGDLLENWNASLGSDTPNRFIINIQPDQLQPVADFFKHAGIAVPAFYPMVRGRLVAVNGHDISSRDYADMRAQRLLDREFNLSWMPAFPEGNTLVAGKWWNDADNNTRTDQLSVEAGIAQTLHLKLGDTLTYDVAGTRFSATITSLRQVKWDSFRVNFFVISPPALLHDYPASWITSFHIASAQEPAFNTIAGRFPNVVVIDVSQILEQLQSMVKQIAGAVQILFLFVLAAGIAVLWAVMASTADARLYEAAVMRTLGASRQHVLQIQAIEFLLTGALAGMLAAAGASVLASVLANKLLDMPYHGAWWIWLIGVIGGALGVTSLGYAGIRRLLATPVWSTLRGI